MIRPWFHQSAELQLRSLTFNLQKPSFPFIISAVIISQLIITALVEVVSMSAFGFINRENELSALENAYRIPTSAFVVIYGRRRTSPER